MSLRAVIFDLDGVVTDTAELHYQAWKWLAEREGFSFDRSINEKLKGVGRAESLGIILAHNGMDLPVAKRLALAEEKNQLYVGLLDALDRQNILPGIPAFLQELEKSKILPALCSSSKNTWLILKKLGLENAFPCVVTGADVMRAKPDPAGFLLAAQRMGIPPGSCAVIEDSFAGLAAAVAAGMVPIGIGDHKVLFNAKLVLQSTKTLALAKLMTLF